MLPQQTMLEKQKAALHCWTMVRSRTNPLMDDAGEAIGNSTLPMITEAALPTVLTRKTNLQAVQESALTRRTRLVAPTTDGAHNKDNATGGV